MRDLLRLAICVLMSAACGLSVAADPLPGTAPLTMEGDLAEQMVAGIDRFLLKQIDGSVAKRSRHWKRDVSSAEKYNASVAPNRARLAKIIGAHDPREKVTALEFVATTSQPALVGQGQNFECFAVRWPAVRGVHGEGLLLVPKGRTPLADVIALPDADQTPEQLAGLAPGIEPESQIARRLAESGCRVVIPALIDRADTHSAIGPRGTNEPDREFLYRPAFEMGRHIIGYEVQKVLAAVDWLAKDRSNSSRRIGVAGYAEGGLVALYASALDPRVDAALVSGYFDSRQDVWQEPIYRNVFGLLDQFGDAELASMVAPRALVVEASRVPEVKGPPAGRHNHAESAAPGRLVTPSVATLQGELDRARALVAGLKMETDFALVASQQGSGPPGSAMALEKFLAALSSGSKLAPPGSSPTPASSIDAAARLARQFAEINEDTQHVMRESEYGRAEYWASADRSSRDLEKWKASTDSYRKRFYDEVIGRFEEERLPPKPRSRQVYDQTLFTGYEVVLDVFPDVFAYGILLVPKGIKSGEKRPTVVCQHGLEGRPTDVADPNTTNPAYNQYACRLAERGFVVFAPQNPYIGRDKFRTLQRKSNPLGKTLYSTIVPQHQQIVDWLASLDMVDPTRIAFYGLSYGGKTAMRVPALVERYCLSICSADFNEWIWKNASTRAPYSYVSTPEYEIFEFDLGNTFNYAEMAALIAPRPFMVERGHRDGVGPDTWVSYEYAKIRLLYADLRIPERTTIEYFDGPHTIHGVGTFDFLHRHLNWPVGLNH